MASAASLQSGNALLQRRKPLLKLRGGLAAKNTLSEHGLAEAINSPFDLLVVPVNLGLKTVHLTVQRTDRSADFLQHTKRVVLRRGHGNSLVDLNAYKVCN
jgi:hypothetical protein